MRQGRVARARDEINGLKGRIAEALVESMFRRASYVVTRIGRESQVQRLMKLGRDEFIPDFLVRKPVTRDNDDRPLHRLVPLEVKYRHDIGAFLQRYGNELCHAAASCWPDLCVVFVTDNPATDRSCFQVIDRWGGRELPSTQDLHLVRALDIYESTVREYEALVKQIFPLLDGGMPRSYPVRVPS